MYSADKIRFVNEAYSETSASRKAALDTLLAMSYYEASWGADFTTQELAKLQPAFNGLQFEKYGGSKAILTKFRKYAKWRQNNGLPCGDGVFNLTVERYISMRESMVSSPEHLATILDTVFEDPVYGTSDIIYRVYLWMVFSGIKDVDALTVTSDEIDFRGLKINHGGEEYPMYWVSRFDFKIACLETEFAVYAPNGSFVSKRVAGKEITRGKQTKSKRMSASEYLQSTIRPILARKIAAADAANQESEQPAAISLGITTKRVFTSGFFYRIYQKEKAGIQPDFLKYAEDEFALAQSSDKPYKISETNTKAATILRLRRFAEREYLNWKKAFQLT